MSRKRKFRRGEHAVQVNSDNRGTAYGTNRAAATAGNGIELSLEQASEDHRTPQGATCTHAHQIITVPSYSWYEPPREG